MRSDITLDKFNSIGLSQRFEYLPELLFVDQLQPFIFVFDDCDFALRVVMLPHNLVFLILTLVRMERIVLRLVVKIIIAESMLKTRHNCLEIFDVVVLFAQTLVLVGHLLGVNKDVGDLLLHFCAYLDRYNCVALCFEQQFALATFKEADICNLQAEVDFMVHT